MKANTTIGENGLLQGALSDEDLQRVNSLIENMKIQRFDCGHGIHTEKANQFVEAIIQIWPNPIWWTEYLYERVHITENYMYLFVSNTNV